ncbi:VOC family protein [Mycolicibacterium sp. PAM1]|uniref:VOC family protein n=1 Tax=Mycolicibacterium sp. PAM1 TaxID=2853535 RepID=UPI001C3C954A|nr:VOC family protein [Mycolicibacterium sp. PAM1]MBV5243497.1 VOC family protein [Mycolicibacterium sp. PAM1]
MHDQTPVQIAWVTQDLTATEMALTALMGAKKWVRMPGVHFGPETCTYRGEPADSVADISLSYAGDTQLELIAPVSGTSIYTEFLGRSGPGLHHVCTAYPDPDSFEAAVARAGQDGIPVVMEGTMPGGMRFAYVGAEHAGVPYLEFAYIPDEIHALFDHIKQEQK